MDILDQFSTSYLRSILDYDSGTGILTWKARNGKHAGKFLYAGKPAGYQTITGHIKTTLHIDGKAITLLTHRVIWKMIYGVTPPDDIDHIDRDPTNNKLTNLRLATRQQNTHNRIPGRESSSGHRGVWWRADRGYWCATIFHDGKKHYIGSSHSKEEAIAMRLAAEQRFFKEFSPKD